MGSAAMARLGHSKLDSLPEAWVYRDSGCELAPACLSCPFPRCIDDEPGGLQAVRRRERDAEMRALAGSMSKDALAERFGLGLRQIYKVLAVKV